MITYADIKSIYRLEKNSTSLQKIGPGFYLEVNVLLKSEEGHREAFVRLIEDIYNLREQRIVLGAIRAQRADVGAPENMTPREKEMYEEVACVLRKHRRGLVKGGKPGGGEVEEEENVEEEKEETVGEETAKGRIKIRLVQPLPAIICTDLRHYGPFKKGDVVEIPQENAKILIRHGMAEEV